MAEVKMMQKIIKSEQDWKEKECQQKTYKHRNTHRVLFRVASSTSSWEAALPGRSDMTTCSTKSAHHMASGGGFSHHPPTPPTPQ